MSRTSFRLRLEDTILTSPHGSFWLLAPMASLREGVLWSPVNENFLNEFVCMNKNSEVSDAVLYHMRILYRTRMVRMVYTIRVRYDFPYHTRTV